MTPHREGLRSFILRLWPLAKSYPYPSAPFSWSNCHIYWSCLDSLRVGGLEYFNDYPLFTANLLESTDFSLCNAAGLG